MLNVSERKYVNSKGEKPKYNKPNIIGYISLHGEHRLYRSDTSQLKYFKYKGDESVNLNLNHNLGNAVPKTDKSKPETFETILKFLLENEKRLGFTGAKSLKEAVFFSFRGTLATIAITPYAKEPWRFIASLFKGNIYLCELRTEQSINAEKNMNQYGRNSSAWGHKFEQYMLSDSPDSQPNIAEQLNENDEFSLVFYNEFQQHRIMFAAEMDGVICDQKTKKIPADSNVEKTLEHLNRKEFVELKTNISFHNPKGERFFGIWKAKKWWIQSFLVGVNKIVCGIKNKQGIVNQLETLYVKDLPSKYGFDSSVCLNFLDEFLSFVKECFLKEINTCGYKKLQEEDLRKVPEIILHFEWQQHKPVMVTQNYDKVNDRILKDWFTNNYGKNEERTEQL